MKKLGVIGVFLVAIIGGGWSIHVYRHLQAKTDTLVDSNLIVDGNNFLNIGRYDEAKQLFLDALKDNPKNAKASWGLRKAEAKDSVSNSVFKQAIDVLYQENPSDPHINLFLGEFYVANNEPDKAISYFKQALIQNPKMAEAYFDLAMLYDQRGKFEEAKSELLLAVEIAPTAKYRNKLAHAYIKLNHLDAATAEYEKISEYPLSALEVAQLYWQRDRLDLALIRQLQAVRWLNDDAVMAKPENQAVWSFQISAEQTLELTKLDEKRSYAYLCISFTLHLLGNVEESERYIQEVRDLKVIRQVDVDAIVNAAFAVLVQEEFSLSPKIEAFKTLYAATAKPE